MKKDPSFFNSEKKQKKKSKNKSKILVDKWVKRLAYIIVLAGAVYGFVLFIYSTPLLPPTSPLNHSERVPDGYILDKPMSDSVQRHMLEHANGRGRPGVIIHYNCTDYDCEDGMLEELKKIVNQYIGFVYLAPGRYDGKIIITKTGQMDILENFDEERIKKFIEN